MDIFRIIKSGALLLLVRPEDMHPLRMTIRDGDYLEVFAYEG